jgi:hypothetical protein
MIEVAYVPRELDDITKVRFLDRSKRRLRSGQIGIFDLSEILGHNKTFHFTLRCRAGFFQFPVFTGHLPKICFKVNVPVPNYLFYVTHLKKIRPNVILHMLYIKLWQ